MPYVFRQGEELLKQLPVYRMVEDAYAFACRELLAQLEATENKAADVSGDTSAACFMSTCGENTS